MSEPGILPEPIPFGKYYLLERVNVGGMAEVYKAKAFGVEGFERLLAIKKILDSIAEDESFIEMFIDEAKIAGQLNHPNIAQIFDLGQVDGSYFIALEYIAGKDLKTQFERARRIGEEVSIPRICYIITKVCEGLAHAHEKTDPQGNSLDIVHRDISPQNILISYEGEVKIIDFGIAKAQGKTSQTQVGILKGKFSYMSPEQVRGLHVDHRSDIFSLGIVMYEMLTLERLFLGESDFDTLEKIRKVEMSPPSLYNPHIPKQLEDIVLKALARTPEERYQSTHELAEDLERFMRDEGYYYKNKDLAAYMKEAFQADIDFENKKLEYYRSLDLKPIEQAESSSEEDVPAEADLSWGDDEMETQIYTKDDEDDEEVEQSITDSDIVYAEDIDPEPATPDSGGGGEAPDIVYPEGAKPAPDDGAGDDEVTQIHVPGAELGDTVTDDDPTLEYDRDDPTEEYDRWDDDLDLDLNKSGGDTGRIEVEERRSPQPTSQIPAVERDDRPQATVTGRRPEKKSGRKTRLGIVAVVAVGVVAVGLGVFFYLSHETTAEVTFDFGQEAVDIAIDDERIEHDGGPYTDTFEAGTLTVVASREGHYDFEDEIEVEAGEPLRLEEQLQAHDYSDTGIDVATSPEEATIVVDGDPIDEKSPTEIRDLEPGSYDIRVELDEYLDVEDTVEVEYDEIAEFDAEFKPAEIDLEVASSPSRSPVSLYEDGEDEELDSGRTPETFEELDAELTYRVVIERNRYQMWEEVVEPGAKREVKLDAELEREEQPVAAAGDSGPTGSSSTDDTGGSQPDPDPEPDGGPDLPSVPDPETDPDPDPEPEEQEEEEPAVAEEPTGTGTVDINSRPAARIFINGQDTGHYTPLRGHELPAGNHEIRLVNEDHDLDEVRNIQLDDGGNERVIHR